MSAIPKPELPVWLERYLLNEVSSHRADSYRHSLEIYGRAYAQYLRRKQAEPRLQTAAAVLDAELKRRMIDLDETTVKHLARVVLGVE